MSKILVCPLSTLEQTLRQSRPRNMIAFGKPEEEFQRPTQIEQYLSLRFNDIAEQQPGLLEPAREHVEQIIGFVENWDQRAPVLFQCWMGISRSTAAAAIALATLQPNLTPAKVANKLRAASPTATPNPLMIYWADDILGLGGCLSEAVANIGRGAFAAEGTPFSIEL